MPPESALRVPTYEPSRPLTLGERKSLGRTRDRQQLSLVLRDPDPSVIEIVLSNPAIVEADVVMLCAQRPIAPSILVSVFEHLRWVMRPRIRSVLATNPDCPRDIALQLAPTLDLQGLRTIQKATDLSPLLRELCVSLIERRDVAVH